MENASKALIIAGAILISILIISLGVIIYQQAAGVVNNNSMSELEVTQFNEPFESYVGKNVRGANVKALISKINASNSTYQGDDSKTIKLDQSGSVKSLDASISAGSTYDVSISGTTSGGLISTIRINENKTTTTK